MVVLFLLLALPWLPCILSEPKPKNDWSLGLYNEKGEILQVQYASLAARSSAPVLFFRHGPSRTEVFLAAHHQKSPIEVNIKRKRLLQLLNDKKTVVALTGLEPDRCAAVSFLGKEVISSQSNYAHSPSTKVLATKLGQWLIRGLHGNFEDEQDLTQRPLAVQAMLKQLGDNSLNADNDAVAIVDCGGALGFKRRAAIGNVPRGSQRLLDEIDFDGTDEKAVPEERLLEIVEELTSSLEQESYAEFECLLRRQGDNSIIDVDICSQSDLLRQLMKLN